MMRQLHTILKDQYSTKNDLKTAQETCFCQACGTSIKQQEYSSLVITLTNISTSESSLILGKTIETIYTEEMPLKSFDPVNNLKKPDADQANPNINNPLALKHDTQFKENMPNTQGAYVARSHHLNYNRTHPYQRGPFN